MTHREFDNILDWLFDSGVRLRTFASVWLVIACLAAICGWFLTVLITGDDRSDYCYDHRPKPTATVYCEGYDLVRPTVWGPSGDGFHVFEVILLIGLAPIGLAGANRVLLGTRSYVKAGGDRWKLSATKRALDERTKRLRAEALSDAAEAETARLERELEALGVSQ